MPNWTSNRLSVVGKEQAVEAFRIINGQHLAGNSYVVTDEEKGNPLNHMNIRARGDFRFSALMPGRFDGEEFFSSWGCKWDTGGESRMTCIEAQQFISFPQNQKFHRQFDWRFSTPWSPPSGWLEFIAAEFPELCMVHSCDDSDNENQYTVSILRDGTLNSDELDQPDPPDGYDPEADDPDDENNPTALAYENAKKIHDERIQEKSEEAQPIENLILAIHADDVETVKAWIEKNPQAVNMILEDHWTALHHSAFAASENVGRLLLQNGASPMSKSSKGLGLMDFILDISSEDGKSVHDSKLEIMKIAAKICPALLEQPLYTGVRPLELAARFGLSEFMVEMIEQTPFESPDMLICSSKKGEVAQHNAMYYRSEGSKNTNLPAWFCILCAEAISTARIRALNALVTRGVAWIHEGTLEMLEVSMIASRPAYLEDVKVMANAISSLDISPGKMNWPAQFRRLYDENEKSEKHTKSTRPQDLVGTGPAKRRLMRSSINRQLALEAIEEVSTKPKPNLR